MPITYDDSKPKQKLKEAVGTINHGKGIATKYGAQILASHLRKKLPKKTGRLRKSVKVGKRFGKWFAIIPESAFPTRIFYPVTFLAKIRRIAIRAGPAVRSATRNRFLNAWRNFVDGS